MTELYRSVAATGLHVLQQLEQQNANAGIVRTHIHLLFVVGRQWSSERMRVGPRPILASALTLIVTSRPCGFEVTD